MGNGDVQYNNQLVRYIFALRRLHNAEFVEDAFTLYHIIQEEAGKASTGAGPALPALGHALAGSFATAGAKALVYPLELLVTRLQVQRQLRGKDETASAARDADAEYASILDAGRKVYKNEGGLRPFYTGLGPDLAKGIVDSFLFFLAYTFLRQYEAKKHSGGPLPVHKELGVGVAAGSFAKLITTPVQNIVTRQQTAALVASRDPTSSTSPSQSDKLSIKDIALQIREERGLAGFWAGYGPSVLLTLNPAITFAVDNLLWRLVPRSRKDKPSPQLTFLVAAVSKAIATTATYPAMLAKSRAQTATPGSNKDESTGPAPEILEKPALNSTAERRRVKEGLHRVLRVLSPQYAILLSLRKIYREEGLLGLYSGLEGEVLKGFLQHGLTMMTKEKVHIGVIESYYLLLKLTKRWPSELAKAREGAGSVAADAQEKVLSVGGTVSEGAKQLAKEGKKAAVGDE